MVSRSMPCSSTLHTKAHNVGLCRLCCGCTLPLCVVAAGPVTTPSASGCKPPIPMCLRLGIACRMAAASHMLPSGKLVLLCAMRCLGRRSMPGGAVKAQFWELFLGLPSFPTGCWFHEPRTRIRRPEIFLKTSLGFLRFDPVPRRAWEKFFFLTAKSRRLCRACQ